MTSRTISLQRAASQLQSVLDDTDAVRVGCLALLKLTRASRAAARAREMDSTRSAGPARQLLEQAIAQDKRSITAFDAVLRTAQIEEPRAREGSWTLHGTIRDDGMRGMPRHRVVLVGESGEPVDASGSAYTDTAGYFRLRFESIDRTEAPPGTGLTVHVYSPESVLVATSQQPIFPIAGEVEYVDIELPPSRD